jgi:starch-binding outer membrane protein, SusD/RagB family
MRKIMRKISFYIILMISILLGNGCADTSIENTNNPDRDDLLSRPDNYPGVVSGGFVALFRPFDAYFGNTNMEWTADYITMTNNVNSWWSQFKVEPRPQFNNTLANTNLNAVTGFCFQRWYAAIASANDVLRKIDVEGRPFFIGNNQANGVNVTRTQGVRAGCYFVRAMAYGYLATMFDQAWVVTETTDVTAPQTLVDYRTVMLRAQADFDSVIAICNRVTFTLETSFMPTQGSPYNSAQLQQLSRTYAANFLAQNARTKAENDSNQAVNGQNKWERIRDLTANGMTQDFVLTLDGINWENGIITIAGLDWYWRVDHRIIRLMDTSYAKRFPLTATSLPPVDTTRPNVVDRRIFPSRGYFRYESGLAFFRPDRGPQLRSHYRFSRYDAIYATTGIGPCVFLYAETNRLLRAEALAMTGDLAGARAILNDPALRRKSVGQLPDVSAGATREQILFEIFKERDIELMLTDYGIHFKDMRRRDMLQAGTVLHFPVPVTQLEIVGQRAYTFGGQSAAGTVGTASGNRSWLTTESGTTP